MIDRLSGRVALLIVVVACLLVVILGWIVLISPERSKAAKLDSQIGDVNTQLAAVTSLLEGPVGRQSLISARVFDKALPSDPKMSQILRQLTALAARAGIELDTISPGTAVPGAGVESLPIALTVKGHYFALQNFLKLLNDSAALRGDQIQATGRLYSVDNITFTGGAAGSAAPSSGGSTTPTPGAASLIQASLALNAYMYSPTSVAPVPVAPTDTSTTATP